MIRQRAGLTSALRPRRVGSRNSPLGPHWAHVHGKLHSLLRMHWDHEPDWHPSPCPLPARRGEGGRRPGEGWFMESEHLQNSDVSWGHEPGLRKSLDCRQTTFRFMERPSEDYSLVWNLRRWPVAGIVTAYDLPSAATDSLM